MHPRRRRGLAHPEQVPMEELRGVLSAYFFTPSSGYTEEYFVLPEAAKHYPGRFMLYVGDVREDKRDIIPAVTHVDGTGRLQSVHKEVSPRYYPLIDAFGRATGVPVLLSTSFDLKDEPIVNTPQEAFQTFTHSGMDVLVLEDHVIEKADGMTSRS